MTHSPPISRPALYAIGALALLGLLGGWLVLLSGGFHHQMHRYTKETVFVTGAAAWLMAAILFGLSALGILALVRARGASPFWQAVACGVVLAPPALFIVTV